jgi:hypothetical protein
VREIRTLHAMWRALETEPRRILNGHEERNLGHKPRRSLRAAAPALDPTGHAPGCAIPETRYVSLRGQGLRPNGYREILRLHVPRTFSMRFPAAKTGATGPRSKIRWPGARAQARSLLGFRPIPAVFRMRLPTKSGGARTNPVSA